MAVPYQPLRLSCNAASLTRIASALAARSSRSFCASAGLPSPGLAYRHRRDRNSRRHLHRGQKRVEAVEGSVHGHPDHRLDGGGRHRARQVCRHAGRGDKDRTAALISVLYEGPGDFRRAMGRGDTRLEADPERAQDVKTGLHYRQI